MSQSHADHSRIPQTPCNRTRREHPSKPVLPRTLPRYKVILHQDESDLMFVVRSIMELTRFPRAEATHKMWEAQHRGWSVILTTYLERAELFVEQFGLKGLTTSIEPA